MVYLKALSKFSYLSITIFLFLLVCMIHFPVFVWLGMTRSSLGIVILTVGSLLAWLLLHKGRSLVASYFLILISTISIAFFYVSTGMISEVLMVLFPLTLLPTILLRRHHITHAIILGAIPLIIATIIVLFPPIVQWGGIFELSDSVPAHFSLILRMSALITSFLLVWIFSLIFTKTSDFLLNESERMNKELEDKNNQLLLKHAELETSLIILENQKQIIQSQVDYFEQSFKDNLNEPSGNQRNVNKPVYEPKISPTRFGYQFEHVFIPSVSSNEAVYFDYFPISHNKLAVAIANVQSSNRSLGLALLAFKGLLHRVISATASPADSLSELNRYVITSRILDRPIPVTYAVIDVGLHHLTIASAGHIGGYLITKHGHTATGGDNQALGVNPNEFYRDRRVALDAGDRFVFISDTLSNIKNAVGEPMGRELLVSLLQSEVARDLPDFISALEKNLLLTLETAVDVDDIAVISVMRRPQDTPFSD